MISPEEDPEVPLGFGSLIFCSGLAKMAASVATYPHEVIRTRLQTQRLLLAASSDVKTHLHRGIINTTKKMIAKEGWTALYKGLSINLLRTIPNSAVTIVRYVLWSISLSVALTCLHKLRIYDEKSSIVVNTEDLFISLEMWSATLRAKRTSWKINQ